MWVSFRAMPLYALLPVVTEYMVEQGWTMAYTRWVLLLYAPWCCPLVLMPMQLPCRRCGSRAAGGQRAMAASRCWFAATLMLCDTRQTGDCPAGAAGQLWTPRHQAAAGCRRAAPLLHSP